MGILDLHVDSIIQQRLFGYDIRRRHRRLLRGQPLFWHADIPRMIEAEYKGACMGIHYYPWESERGWGELQKQVAYLDRVCAEDDRVMRVRRAEDWLIAQREGKLALGPGVEGAHMLNGRIERVARLKELGVMYLTLAHFSTNSAATSSMGRGANERDGLTAFGRRLVQELNAVGIAVDLAHLNTPSALDACAVAKAPVLCTHTGVKAVHNHARNISDEEIDAIAETGGVIGLIFAPLFLGGKLRLSTDEALRHLDHAVKRVGVDHVAIGSDYDGWLPTILSDHRDCRDVSRVILGLQERGYSAEEIEKIAWKNALRVFEGVEAAAGVEVSTPAKEVSEVG